MRHESPTSYYNKDGTRNVLCLRLILDRSKVPFLRCAFVALLLVISLSSLLEAADKVSYGVVAGRDINARDIIIKKGLTDKEVQTIFRNLQKKEGPAVQKVAELSQKLGVTNSALENFFRLLGKEQVPPEKLLECLVELAEHHKQLEEQVRSLSTDDQEIEALRKQAATAINKGDYPQAEGLLAKAENLYLELAKKHKEKLHRDYLQAAAIRASRAQNSLVQFDYLKAAEHFKQAYTTVPEVYVEKRWEYLLGYASSLQDNGYIRGDNNSLEEAIKAYSSALKLADRDRVPLDWAATQNNLGTALTRLGERESGITRLEKAVIAYEEALKEYTRDRVPLDWAATQNNLGTALTRLGERESGITRLEKAVIAYEEALKEYTRDRVPLDWAATQNNLGTALTRLGERESGTTRLEKAVTAYEEALKERTRERVPLHWAMTQNNLGNALTSLGERESGTTRLEKAVTAYEEALKERTRERVPLDWASTQNNLGTALARLGERESGTTRLEKAVTAYEEALKERTRERVPLDWAMTQNNLGNALWRLGKRTKDKHLLEQARRAMQGAYDEYKADGYSQYDADFDQRLAEIAALIKTLP